MNRFLAAIRFLTVLPVPGDAGTSEDDLAGSVPFFPLVGLVLGAIAAGAALLLGWIAPPLVAAAVLVVLLLAFSGGLHMDGLSDSADGLLSSRPRERMLEIMKDSHVGAMGVIAIVAVMLVKFAAFASIPGTMFWPAAMLAPLAGRCAMVLHIALLPYAREKGLGAVFYRNGRGPAAGIAAGVLLTAGAILGLKTFVAAVVCLTVAMLLGLYFHRKLGGATGDTFGACCEIVELVPPLVLACW